MNVKRYVNCFLTYGVMFGFAFCLGCKSRFDSLEVEYRQDPPYNDGGFGGIKELILLTPQEVVFKAPEVDESFLEDIHKFHMGLLSKPPHKENPIDAFTSLFWDGDKHLKINAIVKPKEKFLGEYLYGLGYFEDNSFTLHYWQTHLSLRGEMSLEKRYHEVAKFSNETGTYGDFYVETFFLPEQMLALRSFDYSQEGKTVTIVIHSEKIGKNKFTDSIMQVKVSSPSYVFKCEKVIVWE